MEQGTNILVDELHPNSFGEFVDALIITNLRMWHAQEFFYELDLLRQLDKEQMFDKLKYGSWLNLQRNFQMDGLDATVAALLEQQHPGALKAATQKTEHELIWEKL